MVTYGITWGELKSRCEQEITATRLPITDISSIVYAALISVVELHNRIGSPIFTRWSGTDYTPEVLEIANFTVTTPFFGLAIPSDADKNLDNPIYRVISGDGQYVFQSVSLAIMIDKKNTKTFVLSGTDVDGSEYALEANSSILQGQSVSDSNYYAAVGDVLFVYPSGDIEDINTIMYMYYYIPPYPASDSTLIRVPMTALDLITLTFKEMYLARYGQLLDWRSQLRLIALRNSIKIGD